MTAFDLHNETMKFYGFGYEAMKSVKVCEKCGEAAGAHQLFCRECCSFLTRKSLYDLFKERHTLCPKCKIILPDTAAFCPQCGKAVEK